MRNRTCTGRFWTLTLLLGLSALQLAAAEPPTTQPATRPAPRARKILAAKPPGSPEAAYMAVDVAIREGDTDKAMQTLTDVPEPLQARFRGVVSYFSAIERVRRAMYEKFGNKALESLQLPLGSLPYSVLESMTSEVDGDRARLNVVRPDNGQVVALPIEMVRLNGVWRMPPQCISLPEPSDARSMEDCTVEKSEALVQMLDGIEREVRDGFYQNASEVPIAAMTGMMKVDLKYTKGDKTTAIPWR